MTTSGVAGSCGSNGCSCATTTPSSRSSWAGYARVLLPVRPGFEAPLAHFLETGDVPLDVDVSGAISEPFLDMIEEIKAAHGAGDQGILVDFVQRRGADVPVAPQRRRRVAALGAGRGRGVAAGRD